MTETYVTLDLIVTIEAMLSPLGHELVQRHRSSRRELRLTGDESDLCHAARADVCDNPTFDVREPAVSVEQHGGERAHLR